MIDPIITMIEQGAARHGSIAAFARVCGYSRAALSRRKSGSYGQDCARLDAAIMAALDSVVCPHLGRSITLAACDGYRGRPMPRSNPDDLRHWSACRACRCCAHGGAP